LRARALLAAAGEPLTVHSRASFGVDAAVELYVVSLGDAKVYRVAEGP
jgi:hypothetical protein